MDMGNKAIPQDIKDLLTSRNPYELVWGTDQGRDRWQALKEKTPEREVSDSLLEALKGFPPPEDKFVVLEFERKLSTGTVTVTVGTERHVRVTATARYLPAQKIVKVLDFEVGPRKLGSAAKRAQGKKKKR